MKKEPANNHLQLDQAMEILNKIIYITIASVSEDGYPWNSPVYSAFDNELNFYWSSDKESQHSKNIRSNGKIFLVMYDSTAEEGTGEGVYVQASALELGEKDEILVARRLTQERKGQLDEMTADEPIKFTGSAVRRVYKATPQKIWINDVELDEKGKYIRDIRIEIPLEKLKSQIGNT
jgi:nitroimidazol reductase NimA-like FMN-containing flavoprotein (pyridoxamine 5'-phosphate oxidase superfamily)